MARGFWTEERVAELTRLHRAGHSFGEIAKALGVTRATASGKLDRLGLTHRTPGRRTYRKEPDRQPLPRGGQTQARIPPPPAPELLHLVGGLEVRDEQIGRAFLLLSSAECHWPLSGSGADMRCCDQPVQDDGGPWFCPRHRAEAFSRPAPEPHELARMDRALVFVADRAGRARPERQERPAALDARPLRAARGG